MKKRLTRLGVAVALAVFMSAGVAALPVSNPMNMVVAEFLGIGFTRRTDGNNSLVAWGNVVMWNLSLLVGVALALLTLSGLTIGLLRLGGWAKEGREREKHRKHAEKAHQKNE